VSDEKYGEVLGIHIIGPLATEILAEAAATLNLEGTIDDMMNMIHAHPTVWEGMGDAFCVGERVADKRIVPGEW